MIAVKESDIQAAIVEYLTIRGILVFSVSNELAGGGKPAVARMVRAKRMGLMAGVSDLVVVMQNRIIFMEVKTPTGRLSDAQEQFRDTVMGLGFEYCVARSVDDAKDMVG